MGHASSLFNGQGGQTLIDRVTPTADQREFLQKHWNLLAEHLKVELKAKHGYTISTWLQGSYKYGTLIKPVRRGEEYDVDVGVYFEWEKQELEPTAKQLRDWVQGEVLRYASLCDDLTSVAEPSKERCSRASYVRQFHIDTPVYHLDPQRDKRLLATLSNGWESSDPKTIYKWFKAEVTGDFRVQLLRMIRYLKAWAAVSFQDVPDARPSSIFLTVLVTQVFKKRVVDTSWTLAPGADDDALVRVIEGLHERLLKDRVVPNPKDKNEDLNRMSADGWQVFIARLDTLLDIALRAKDTVDENSAAVAWSEAFSFLMPLPDVHEVEVVDESSGRTLMVTPEVEIQVYARNPRRLVATHRNSVPGVARNCDLVFNIVNPQLVPQFATVEWTVRNHGDDADRASNLGHRNIGLRSLSCEEQTSYVGTHSMDCIVKNNGELYSMRRVPVTIRDTEHVPRNPPKPAYTKLRSPRRRR